MLFRLSWVAACAAMLSCSAIKRQPNNHPWFHPNPDRTWKWPDSAAVNESDYAEVRVTQLHNAIYHLQDKPFIELDPDLVDAYADPRFRVRRGKKAYLVRSLYSNGATGGYSLQYWKRKLSVSHYSLGSFFQPNSLPLVVLLDSPPSEVFVTYGGAR